MTSNRVHRLSALAIMIALDYLLTPIFRIEGMVFMSSVMNVIAGTFMTPLYAVAMAFIVAIIFLKSFIILSAIIQQTGSRLNRFEKILQYRPNNANFLCRFTNFCLFSSGGINKAKRLCLCILPKCSRIFVNVHPHVSVHILPNASVHVLPHVFSQCSYRICISF